MFGKNDRRQLKRRCIIHGIFLSTHLNVNGEDVSSRSQDLFGGQLAVRVTSKKIIGVIVWQNSQDNDSFRSRESVEVVGFNLPTAGSRRGEFRPLSFWDLLTFRILSTCKPNFESLSSKDRRLLTAVRGRANHGRFFEMAVLAGTFLEILLFGLLTLQT